jgi:hypothetical protein
MERDNSQCIKRFAFSDSAAGKGALPEEKWMRSCCRRAGRPTCSGRIESRHIGGQKKCEIMEEVKKSSSGELLALEDKPMGYIAFYIDKLYGMDIVNKINSMLCHEGVA